MDEIITLISNVGFPIAAFCAMYYMCNTTIKDLREMISELKTSIDKLVVKEDYRGEEV